VFQSPEISVCMASLIETDNNIQGVLVCRIRPSRGFRHQNTMKENAKNYPYRERAQNFHAEMFALRRQPSGTLRRVIS
jgi:hypothetical protein